jgi:quercetin dioxygenase-like cupin family protein
METVKHLKFPMTFDVTRLQADLARITDNPWTAHYNKAHYSGNWTSVSLLAAGGKSDAIHAVVNRTEPILPTELLADCAYFREVIDSFQFNKTIVRLLRLDAGAVIQPHRDHCLGYEDGEFRLHIPVVTNPGVEFLLAGERLIMDPGTCWYINANEEHSVANRGTEDRIHLVIDGERNAWTDALFFSMAPESSFQPVVPEMDPAAKALMIAELQRMDTPAARELLAQLSGKQL